MKIKEIINTIDKSEPNSDWVDIEKIGYELGIQNTYNADYQKFESRVKAYWFVSWVCTDTRVGGRVYFLDDIPVAVSFQNARKNDEHFEWICKDYAVDVKNFLIECCDDDFNLTIADMNEDIDIDAIKSEYGAY